MYIYILYTILWLSENRLHLLCNEKRRYQSTDAHTKARYSMILFINLISGSRLCVCNQYQKSFHSEIANSLPFSYSCECVVRTLTSLALNLKQSGICVARETGATYTFKVDLQNK